MFVYGDPQFYCSLTVLQERLVQQIEIARSGNLDDLRTLLIQCGQLEQALVDVIDGSELEGFANVKRVERVTDLAAAAFYRGLRHLNQDYPDLPASVDPIELLPGALRRLANPSSQYIVKVPEGFAFYGLFPEQYCAAALEWARQYDTFPSHRVLVVGIRSIGTTLSSIISVLLQAVGWETQRLTVRPHGEPFQRRVNLGMVPTADFAIVVDEGPGLSGSSMSAVAEALIAAGFTWDRIAFFPGHERGPGNASSEDVQKNWRSISQFFVPLERVRWAGRSLDMEVAAVAAEGMGRSCASSRILSNGAWRKELYNSEKDWPAAPGVFEKMKWHCRFDGNLSVLWKFVGLGPWVNPTADSIQNAWTQLNRRADLGFSPRPISSFRGFVGMPWVAGEPLSQADFRDARMFDRLAGYVIGTAGPALSETERVGSTHRLQNILVCNTEKSFGSQFGSLAHRFPVEDGMARFVGACGDGDLAAHNWIRRADGAVFKFGGVAHDVDHTLVGRQPLHWAVAGAVIENGMDRLAIRELCAAMERRGVVIGEAALRFYSAAYAVFKLGQTAICAEWADDDAERARLDWMNRYYCSKLAYFLEL